jgi:hypothetical protein
MIRVFGCEIARELLPAFVDGELVLEKQVELDVHLRSCRTCAAHIEDLRLIGDALRLRVPKSQPAQETGELQRRRGEVLIRVRAEQDQGFGAKIRQVFDDPHVVFAGLGATMGVIGCILLTLSVVSAIGKRASDSLAELIDALSSPAGSERNPMVLDGRVLPPSVAVPELADDSPALRRLPKDDAIFALATVVTREGRISDYELLPSHHPVEDSNEMRAANVLVIPSKADISYVRDAVKWTRFAPAQSGGTPVAVNMVWLLARTTVKGSPRPFELDELRDQRARPTRGRG